MTIKRFFQIYNPQNIVRRFWFNVAKLPLLPHHRSQILKLAGIDVKGYCFVHDSVRFDTVYPECIHLAEKCAISSGCVILTHYRDVSKKEKSFRKGDVYIGKEAFLGINTIICNSVTIGEGAIVGAGSIVTKDIPPYQVWAGNPARYIKDRAH